MITFDEFDACSNKAYKPTSNCGGIEIAINDAGDAVAWCDRWSGGINEHSRLCRDWIELKYTAKGRAYFFYKGRREYLDTFMRK